MFLDDAVDHVGRTTAIPDSIGIDDQDGAAFADVETGTLRSKHAAAPVKFQLLEPLAEMFPRRGHLFLGGTLGGLGIVAHQDVPLDVGDAELACFALCGF